MARNFLQVKKFLDAKFEDLQVEGGNYPPPPLMELVARVLSIVQLVGIAWMIMGGEKMLRMVGYRQMPRFYYTLQENSVPLAIGLFLVIPQFIQKMTVTGAFEIYLDDETVFSKIEMGRFPQMEELTSRLSAAGVAARS